MVRFDPNVVAAGNNAGDIDDPQQPSLCINGLNRYPAVYRSAFENMIVVAASQQDDDLASFTNWGSDSVDLAAPGSNMRLVSAVTPPPQGYDYDFDPTTNDLWGGGTSFAVPYVVGTAALVWTQFPDWTPAQVVARIRKTARKDATGNLTDANRPTSTRRLLNAWQAVCYADFNMDGQVDFDDYLDFMDAYTGEEEEADINGDGNVDMWDYLDFMAQYNTECV